MEIIIGLFLFTVVVGIVAYLPSRQAVAKTETIISNVPFKIIVEKTGNMKTSIAVSDFTIFIKRAMDITGSILALVLTAPFFLIIPVLIKLTSEGPVFYVQQRVGLNRRKKLQSEMNQISEDRIQCSERRISKSAGQVFSLLKFRTMVCDAEKKCGPVWAVKNDPRITKIGKILRKTRLDEIPQFLNVLKGEMSLVGPRPERPFFVKDFVNTIPNYELRCMVKPGITGLSQINNGYDDSLDSVIRKVNYDIDYIKRWNILNDLKIILRTVMVVFTTKGAL